MFSTSISGDRDAIVSLSAIPASVRQALLRRATALAEQLRNHVVAQKLSGQVLNVRSGALRASIRSEVTQTDSGIAARVYSSGVPYAAIQEFGGQTPAHVIEAKKAMVLAFEVGGNAVFARRVNHPGSKIPERSFLRASLSEMGYEIAAGMKDAVLSGLRSAV